MSTLVPSRGRMRLIHEPSPAPDRPWATGKTMPVCGDIARRLKAEYPDLVVDHQLIDRFRQMKKHQDVLAWISLRDDAPGDKRLFPYQRVGAHWLRTAVRGILADGQGSGKTVTALAAIYAESDRVLVICSNAKRRDWWEHALVWTDREAGIVDGDADERATIIRHHQEGVLVIGYEAAVRHAGDLVGYDTVIVDEAHVVRNRKTRLFRALRVITRDVNQLILLTATPTVNTSLDVWPLLCLVDPDRWGSYWSFVFRFHRVVQGRYGLEVSREPLAREKKTLERILSTYILRREGLLNLPEMTWEDATVTVTGEWSRLYRLMKSQGRLPGADIPEVDVEVAMITRLRQLAIDPALLLPDYDGPSKFDALEAVLRSCPGQVLVFSMFAEAAIRGAELLGGDALHGGLTERHRQEAIARFRSGETRVLFVTYGTGGEGLNLTEANRAVLLDPPWHPAGVQHAIHRIYRHGQKSSDLGIIRLISTGTVEEHILEIIDAKRRVTVEELLGRLSTERDRERYAKAQD